MKYQAIWLLLTISFISSILTACGSEPGVNVEPSPTPTATSTARPTIMSPSRTNTPSPQIPELQQTPTVTYEPPSACPQVDIVYQLDYEHEVIQNMPSAYIKHEAEPNSAFYLTIREDRTADNVDFPILVPVTIQGKIEDCILEGNAELSAEISGSCMDGKATLQIIEHWESLTTTVTCPDNEPQTVSLEGMFSSAPEDQFVFDLSKESDTQVLEASFGMLSVYYSWTLHEYGLGIVPLVPQE